jgi:hypothetical protein
MTDEIANLMHQMDKTQKMLERVTEAVEGFPRWHPIETAPKLVECLIATDSHERGCVIATLCKLGPDEWRWVDEEHEEWRNPTHWMPLPEPPK